MLAQGRLRAVGTKRAEPIGGRGTPSRVVEHKRAKDGDVGPRCLALASLPSGKGLGRHVEQVCQVDRTKPDRFAHELQCFARSRASTGEFDRDRYVESLKLAK